MRLVRWSLLFAAVSAGCAAEAGPSGDEVWRKALVDERARTDEEFRSSPTSPLAAIDRRALRGADVAHVQVEAGSVRLTDRTGPGAALSFRGDGAGRWTWQPDREGIRGSLRDGDRPLAPGPVAEPALFRLGRFSLLAQPIADSLVVMVHDAERAERRAFERLDYFAPERRFVVSAHIERWREPARVTLPTTLRLEKSYRRRARLQFSIDGQPCELVAFAPEGARPGALFVPFRDATSGRSTYGGGRYLDLQEPSGDSIEIDFNRAYNPMCNYSPAFNCPIPPAENRLRVAIEAGQRTYAH
jgi:uncharacterized protein